MKITQNIFHFFAGWNNTRMKRNICEQPEIQILPFEIRLTRHSSYSHFNFIVNFFLSPADLIWFVLVCSVCLASMFCFHFKCRSNETAVKIRFNEINCKWSAHTHTIAQNDDGISFIFKFSFCAILIDTFIYFFCDFRDYYRYSLCADRFYLSSYSSPHSVALTPKFVCKL